MKKRKAGSPKTGVRRGKTEDGSWRKEVGSRKTGDRSWRKEAGSPKTEVGKHEWKVGRQKLEELEMNNYKLNDMIGFKFEKLIIWQKAMDFGEQINTMAHNFPQSEMYNLFSQIRRAVDSIALNISEGSIGQTNPEFKRFMGYSIRSLAEVVTCLHKAKRRKYITVEEFENQYKSSFELMNMMIAFKNKIQ